MSGKRLFLQCARLKLFGPDHFQKLRIFYPYRLTGKEVVLNGDFSVKTLSEQQAKQYAEDAGNNPEDISGQQKEYSVVAMSIVVPKSK